MERVGDEVVFTGREPELSGCGAVPIGHVAAKAQELYAHSDELAAEACATEPQSDGMPLFTRSVDVRMLADRLLEQVPPQPDDDVTLVADEVEEFLKNGSLFGEPNTQA